MTEPHPVLSQVPNSLLLNRTRASAMLAWLNERGLPRPTLAEVEAERYRRGRAHTKPRRTRMTHPAAERMSR